MHEENVGLLILPTFIL